MRGSSIYHHQRQHVLRLERALDPRSPRFEDTGLGSNGGGEVQPKGAGVGPIADAAAKCGIGFEAGCKLSGLRRTFERSKQEFAVLSRSRTMATRMIGGFDERDTCLETELGE